jgi:hypothetical protein
VTRLHWLKHAAVFIAAIALVWFAGVLPALINPPAGAPPSSLGPPTLVGLLSAWPIYIAVAIVQALTFHYVKRFATPIFLTGIFLIASAMAWRYAGLAL